MTTVTPFNKTNCVDTFYYNINDYLQNYYSLHITETSAFADKNALNYVKVVRPKSTKMSSKSSSMKNRDELLASYTNSHIYTKDRLAQTSAKVTAFFTRHVNSSAQIGASNIYNEFQKMEIPKTEITLSLDDKPSARNNGRNLVSCDRTHNKHTSRTKPHRSILPVINSDILKKPSKIECTRGFVNQNSIEKSYTRNILPKI